MTDIRSWFLTAIQQRKQLILLTKSKIQVRNLSSKTVVEKRKCRPNIPAAGLADVNPQILKNHEDTLFKKKKLFDSFYIIKESIADLVIKHMADMAADTHTIFEITPGPGVLTKKLLRVGNHHIRVFEPRGEFWPYMQELESLYPDRFSFRTQNLSKMSSIKLYDDHTDGDLSSKLIEGIMSAKWTDDPPVRIVGAIPQSREQALLRFLLAKIASMSGIYSLGRCELCLFMPGNEYKYMIAQGKDGLSGYRGVSVQYQTYFNIKLLETVPSTSFYPLLYRRKGKSPSDAPMHLIKMTPKRDLLQLIPVELLPGFHVFTKHLMRVRSAKLIASIEQWIPKSGPRLIKEGYTTFTQTGELTFQDYIRIYLLFSSWPEYSDSSFQSVVHHMSDVEDVVNIQDSRAHS